MARASATTNAFALFYRAFCRTKITKFHCYFFNDVFAN